MSNLQQERLLLVLAPVAGGIVKQNETAVYQARIRAAADDGGIVRDANLLEYLRIAVSFLCCLHGF